MDQSCSKKSNVIVRWSTSLALLAIIAVGFLVLEYQRATSACWALRYTDTFEVLPGQTVRQVSEKLFHHDLLATPWHFYFIWLLNEKPLIQAGLYDLTKETTPRLLLDAMAQGRVKQFAITLVEGWTFAQVLEALRNEPHLNFNQNDVTHELIHQQLNMTVPGLEGWFFPDTYFFTKNTDPLELLKRAHQKMMVFAETQWKHRQDNLPYQSITEMITMASLIERETAVNSERDLIAGVFVNRLRLNMPLQTDPTVIYALGDDYDGRLYYKHLEIDSPYNTYRYKGLPPTPIALPSAASIRAALNPATTDALYFVADGKGGHQFSTTLEQHNRAVKAYRRYSNGNNK